MIPASERAKTVHALDRSATVTGVGELVDPTYFDCHPVTHHSVEVDKARLADVKVCEMG
jgi:hypothetical protein